jgi:hypothetical protein
MNQTPDGKAQDDQNRKPFLPGGLWYIVLAGAGLFSVLYWFSRAFSVTTEKYAFWVQGGVNILIFGAILVQALIYRRQWDAMQNSIDRTDKIIEEMQAQRRLMGSLAESEIRQSEIMFKSLSETHQIVVQNERAVEAAEQSASVAERAFHSSERPHFGITGITTQFEAGKAFHVSITFMNGGKTPSVALLRHSWS